MLTALILATISQVPATGEAWSRVPRVERIQRAGGRVVAGPALPFFSAFTASGAGTFGACSTTPPTGSKGEALTFTRASSATCSKVGLATTGIQPGDLVTLTTNQPRVEPDADGVLAVRVESQRTNNFTRSQEWGNAAWVKYRDGAAALPTVPASDSAVAPDGTTTADTASIGATIGSQSSIIYQGACATGAQCAVSAYVSGPSGSGTTDICAGTSGAACAPCAWTATSWTLCQRTGIVGTVTSAYVGNATFYNGGTVRPAQDVYVWQGQAEVGATLITSAIPTTSATVTRNADVVSFATTLSGSTFSAATNMTTPSALVANSTAFQVYVDANNSVTAYVDGSAKLVCNFRIGGVDNTVTSAASVVASASNRVACQYGAAGRSACVGGTCTTTAGALTLFTGAATFYIGTRSATGNESNGIHSRLCYDPSDARCI